MKRFIPIIIFIMLLLSACGMYHWRGPVPGCKFNKEIKILSLPTRAKIFVDSSYVGITPLVIDMSYLESRKVNIRAEPVFCDEQFPQNVMLEIPSVPQKLTFYMNFQPPREKMPWQYEREPLPELEIDEVELPDPEVIEKVIVLDKVYLLPDIYFDTNKWEVPEDQLMKLDRLVRYLNDNQDMHLEIFAHADKRSSDEYNKALSIKRGNSVRTYLIDKGVDDSRLEVYARGEAITVTLDGAEVEYGFNRIVNFRLKLGK
ncbi:MAG: OmpA family protein [Candidatus Cloacimonetes bacterium]|nr:OmpA family protein [Candidatus Cloacimonadota bacterium]